jgi:hypothetical protein
LSSSDLVNSPWIPRAPKLAEGGRESQTGRGVAVTQTFGQRRAEIGVLGSKAVEPHSRVGTQLGQLTLPPDKARDLVRQIRPATCPAQESNHSLPSIGR